MPDKLPEKELAKVLAWLSQKMRCPLCGYRYNLEGVKTLPKISSSDVSLHTNCGECQSSLLFALNIRGGEVSLVGVVSDLTYEDASKFRLKDPISANEVIDWHNFWRRSAGNFKF